MISNNMITHTEIKDGIPEDVRQYFDVGSVPLPREHFETMVNAFHKAINLFIPKIRIRKRIGLYFAKNPFKISIPNGVLSYESSNEEIIANTVEDMIFIECERTAKYNYNIQVAIFLEELVHALMNVQDEELTSHIVSTIYNGVELKNGKYCEV